jgi:membrane-associated phospholipid phosphatase
VSRPDRLVPEATLLALIPVSFVYDSDIQEYYEQRPLDSTTKNVSSALQVLLPAIPVTIGTVDWARGDGGRNFEVVAESLGGVVVVQQLLARTISRDRPDHSDQTSFPSGHTSFAFAATTLIVRDLHDPSDDSFHAVDALIYLPAVFAGWERIAADHHWTSDVTCGAFLGVFLTNWIWDAHFRSEEETRPTIYMEDRPRGIAWRPTIDLIEGRIAFGIQVGF